MKNQSVIAEKSFNLALSIIRLSKRLNEKTEFEISNQLLRCATSVGANVREGRQSESKKDFAHKMNIAQKECGECVYWLELIEAAEILGGNEIEHELNLAKEVLRMLRSTVYTTRQNLQKAAENSITKPSPNSR